MLCGDSAFVCMYMWLQECNYYKQTSCRHGIACACSAVPHGLEAAMIREAMCVARQKRW